jgi:mycothiol synthase
MTIPTTLPAGLSLSAGVPDLDELRQLIMASEVAITGTSPITTDELRVSFGEPTFEPATDIVCITEVDGSLVAAAHYAQRAPYVSSFTRGWVSPDRIGRGIGGALLTWAKDRAAQAVPRAPEDARVTMSVGCNDRDERAKRLFEAHGFSVARYFLEMEIRLDHDIAVTRRPEGITVRTLRPDEDLDRLAAVVLESFRDHFGFTESSLEAAIERWTNYRQSDMWSDDLAWVAEDGDDMVAQCICLRTHGAHLDAGYVANLGVLPSHRGRGLARHLLTNAFAEYARRGMETVALHVDADSLTGATRLYRSVGMGESQREVDYELELRPGTDLVVR